MATNIGMMDGAYFVGRSEILAWINSTLQLHLNKVEEVRFLLLLLLPPIPNPNLNPSFFNLGISLLKFDFGLNCSDLFVSGLLRSGALSADGCGSSGDGSDAQGQLRRQERV